MSGRVVIPRLGDAPDSPFPPTSQALDDPNGLLAAGGDLTTTRLLEAYRRGIFPWYSAGSPILWWSPSPRCVIVPGRVHLSRRTRRRYNSGRYRLSVDAAFAEVVRACALPRPGEYDTWITADMEQAYNDLHGMGHAHSLEVWLDGELAGGIYGLAIGATFFGESMFSNQTDGSKIALVALCRLMEHCGMRLLDCQVVNPHLKRMGAEEWPRERFESELSGCVHEQARFPASSVSIPFEPRW